MKTIDKLPITNPNEVERRKPMKTYLAHKTTSQLGNN